MSDLIISNLNLPATPFEDSGKRLLKSVDFFQPLKLMGNTSKQVTNGLIDVGNYAVCKGDEVSIDLGNKVDVIVLGHRYKAVDYSDRDNIVVSYDPGSQEFLRIEADSKVKDSDAMCGPEYLLYLLEQKKFVVYILASPSAQFISEDLASYKGAACTLTSKTQTSTPKGQKKSFTYWVPVVGACTTPYEGIDGAELNAQAVRFVEETKRKPEVELAEESSGREM